MGWNYGISVPGSGRGRLAAESMTAYAWPPEAQVHTTPALAAATALGVMPADEQSWVEVASVLSKSVRCAMSLIGRLKRLSERVDRMADPDDPTYDPPDRAITRADDKSQAARDAEDDERRRDGP